MGKRAKRLRMAKYAKKYASIRATLRRLRGIVEEHEQPVPVEVTPAPTTPQPPELKEEKATKPAPKKKPALKKKSAPKKKPASKPRFSKTKAKKSTSEG